MEAYNYYLKARKPTTTSFSRTARKLAEKAVAIDPTFAIAYSLLSHEAALLLDYPARDEALEKAKTYSAKGTEKERLFIEARYASIIERDPAKRLRLLKELVEKYPDDKLAHFELGQYYFAAERPREAAAEYERSAAIDPRYAPAYNMIGYSYSALGDFAKAAQAFERHAELNPGLPNPLDSLAEMNLLMGNLDEAAARYKAVLAKHPDYYNSFPGLIYVSALKEDYGDVERWLAEGLKQEPLPQAKMEGYYLQNFYGYLLGRLDRSLATLLALRGQAEKYKFDMGVGAVDWVTGFIYTDQGNFEKARKAFEGWRAYFEKTNPADRTSSAALRSFFGGWVELKQGRLEAAKARVAEIEDLLSGLDQNGRRRSGCLPQLLAAEVALAGDAVDEAIRIGEKIDFGILTSVNTPNMVTYNLPLSRTSWPGPTGKKATSTRPSPNTSG